MPHVLGLGELIGSGGGCGLGAHLALVVMQLSVLPQGEGTHLGDLLPMFDRKPE